jgi:hypothetical protein
MKNFSLACGVVLNGLLALGNATSPALCQEAPAAPATLHLEAENAQLKGPSVVTVRKGFSGSGYVSDFSRDSDTITWTLTGARAGLYDVRIRYCSPFGEKGYELIVNGAKISAMFAGTGAEFETATAGKVELRAGANTVVLAKGWGYYDIDAIDFVPVATNSTLKPVPAILADPNATAEVKALMSFLRSTYGKKTLSGQYDDKENEYIRTHTGKLPAIKGGDLIEYSPSRLAHGADPKNLSKGSFRMPRAARSSRFRGTGMLQPVFITERIPTRMENGSRRRGGAGFMLTGRLLTLKKCFLTPSPPITKRCCATSTPLRCNSRNSQQPVCRYCGVRCTRPKVSGSGGVPKGRRLSKSCGA